MVRNRNEERFPWHPINVGASLLTSSVNIQYTGQPILRFLLYFSPSFRESRTSVSATVTKRLNEYSNLKYYTIFIVQYVLLLVTVLEQ